MRAIDSFSGCRSHRAASVQLSMAGGDLFQGLPPPAPNSAEEVPVSPEKPEPSPLPAAPTPPPPLKSALKRRIPPEPQPEGETNKETNKKRLRFKTTTDASEKQVVDAMQKIASHISNPSKFSKASKLALQVIQAGSVTNTTNGYFFAILEAAMANSASCNDPSLRADYQALFTAAEEVKECLSKQQQNQLTTWIVKAVIANDLYTDDSFVFSKAAGKIKECICNLPVASPADDREEAASLEKDTANITIQNPEYPTVISELNEETLDPFGLDALLPERGKKVEKLKTKKDIVTKEIIEEEGEKRYLKSQRGALLLCLETAARRYRVAWAQTIIDILVKHAFDNVQRFTSKQRDAIEKLWASIRDQQIRRRQGKSVTGKLDVTAFESLQEKYANQKISIRHSVGGGGERRAQQWLG